MGATLAEPAWQDPCSAPWLPYCGILAPPPGTGGRMVEVERRGGAMETGIGDQMNWRGVREWRYRDDLR